MLESRFLQAHTKDSRRRTVGLESTPGATASSTTAVASEATASTAAERHFIWLLYGFSSEDRGPEGSVGGIPASWFYLRRSLCATVRRVDWRVQLRYAAWAIAMSGGCAAQCKYRRLEEFPRKLP